VAANFVGSWRECVDQCGEAERIFREQCTGVAHERANAIYWRLWALSQCGRLMALRRELPAVLKDAHERGDLYLSTNVRLRGGFLTALADDDPDGAVAELETAMRGWTFVRISHQHVWDMFDRTQVLLYRGDGRRAWETFESGRWMVRATLTVRVQFIRVLCAYAGGRAAVAAASERPGLLREARRHASRLRGEAVAWSSAMAMLVEAGIASVDGSRALAEQRLREAIDALDALDMTLHAAAARRWLGTLVGGDDVLGLIAESEAAMQGEGIKNPARMAAMLAPGAWVRA